MSKLATESTAPVAETVAAATTTAGTATAGATAENTQAQADELPLIGRAHEAQALVNSYVPWSATAGLIPVPMFDMAALLSVQLRMLAKLSELYGVPFIENGVKSTVTSLIGTVLSANLGAGLGSLVKTIPVIGSIAGMAAAPSAYSAVTYAIGRVFVAHFESGGTFLDFDPEKMRAFFVAEYEKAKSAIKPAAKSA